MLDCESIMTEAVGAFSEVPCGRGKRLSERAAGSTSNIDRNLLGYGKAVRGAKPCAVALCRSARVNAAYTR